MGWCWKFSTVLLWLNIIAFSEGNDRCARIPSEYTAPRSSSVGKFRLRIFGNPESYLPDTNYTVFIEAESNDQYSQRFTEFNLVVKSQDSGSDAGKFELHDIAQTKFSEYCRNMIKQTTKSYKERVSVQWTAPPSGSGCVTFRTTVIVRKDTWFQDDEPLTKVLCEDNNKVFDEQPPVLEGCNACSEATYEVTFEGLWSRHTHPHNFPQDLFQTKFSKIIGAAHNKEYSLWEYEKLATDGFREVAENGDITALEAELKEQGSNIRTIIRAPGIGHPDAIKKTFATFRTTPEHHLMSLVSMIVPSPDWIVGVSKLELCLSNGSWIDRKILNLYPWDAGTDSGTTYESADDPTIPREIIHRISTSDPSSPFYEKNGEAMKPLARLEVVRLNLFEKDCGPTEEETTPDDDAVCQVTKWSSWSDCEWNCTEDNVKGYRSRIRNYTNSYVAVGCNKQLNDYQECKITCWDSKCKVTDWSDYSSCYNETSYACPRRVRYRFVNGPEYCKTVQDKPSEVEYLNCPEDCVEASPNNCKWDLGECNVTCGQGYKEFKLIAEELEDNDNENEYPTEDNSVHCLPPRNVPCDTGIPCDEEENPTDGPFPHDIPPSSLVEEDSKDQRISPNPIIDCLVSRWSAWSACSATCGKSFMHRHRQIMTHSQNGGKPCPRKLYKKKSCRVPTTCDEDEEEDEDPELNDRTPKRNCTYSAWEAWSACTVTCGEGMKQKTRSVIEQAPGAQCDKRIKTKPCHLPSCPH